MEIPIDYLLVRAAGIRSHLLDRSGYYKLVDLPDYASFIDQLQHSAYQQVMARDYTGADPVLSFIRAIYRYGEQRWNLLTFHLHGELLEDIRLLKQLTDMKNLILIVEKLPQEDTLGFNPVPGGTVFYSNWRELRSSKTLRELQGKLLLLAPELYELTKQLLNSRMSPSQRIIEIIKLLTRIGRGTDLNDEIELSALTFFFLDLINKLVLRISLRISIFDKSQIRLLSDQFNYWRGLPGFLGREFDVNSSPSWYQQCIDRLTSKVTEVKQDQEPSFLEDEISRINLNQMEKYWRYSQNRLIRYYITIYKIQLEVQNLCWIGYGLYHNIENTEIKRRIIV